MLFRKDIPKSCLYCARGASYDKGTVLCARKGIVPEDHKCRRFKYDPCKRVPAKAKALDFSKYAEEDYSL